MTDNTIHEKIINIINLFNKGDFDSVLKLNESLIERYKNNPVLYNLQGAALAGNNQHDQAIEFYKKAIDFEPQNEEIYRNLSKSLIAIKKFDDAIKYLETAISINNTNPDAYFNLGLAFSEKKLVETGIKNFNIALEQQKNFPECYYNLGNVYLNTGDSKEAIIYYNKALGLNKYYYKALNNKGVAYIQLHNFDEAIKHFNQALTIKSNYPEALSNLGIAFMEKKEFEKALEYFNRALKINENFFNAYVQKLFIQRRFCDWSETEKIQIFLDKLAKTNERITPWQLFAIEDNPQNHLKRAKNYSRKFILKAEKKFNYKNKKIKIGYFTPDFFEHAGMMNMAGIFQNHNKDEFEISAFDYGVLRNDSMHKKIKNYFDNFFYVQQLSDKEIANFARKQKIDIAIHRNGHSQNSRSNIFAYRAAQLQISYLGYPGSTGLDYIDYMVADKVVIPPENQKYYSEKIIFMPDSYYPADNTRKISEKKFQRYDFKIPEDAFVFCCFNNSYKISFEEYDIWMKLLKEIENSYLLLLSHNKLDQKNLLFEAKKRNVGSSRIKFFSYTNIEDHLARHALADLYLDTFNYNGHTSVVDALWTGVPVITKLGQSLTARVCGSLLTAFNLSEMITKNNHDYKNLAYQLAKDKILLKKIKTKVSQNKFSSKLFNTKEYVMNLERGFKLAHDLNINKNEIKNIYL